MSTHRVIDPGSIPGDGLDPDGVLAAADALADQGEALREHGAHAVARWRGLSTVYEAPEADRLFTVMNPVEAGARDVGDGVELLAAALRRYAEAIRPIKASLARTRTDARVFRSSIASDPDWRQDQRLVDANTDLVERVNAQQVALWEAERACANEIRALYCAPPWHVSTGEDDPLGYGYAALPAEAAMPWGSAVKREDACPKAAAVQVKRFVWDGVVVDGLWGTVTGLAGFAGFRDWRYSNATLCETWMGMSDLFPFTVMGVVMHLSDGSGVYSAQRTGTAWLGLGKGVVSWDTWDDDPGRAAGGAVFNIATALLPAGAAVSGTKGAATAANAASKGAKVSAWLARGAEIVDLTDPLTLGARGLRAALPRLDDLVAGLRGVERLDDALTLDLPVVSSTLDDLPSGAVHDGPTEVAVRDVEQGSAHATSDATLASGRSESFDRQLVGTDGRHVEASDRGFGEQSATVAGHHGGGYSGAGDGEIPPADGLHRSSSDSGNPEGTTQYRASGAPEIETAKDSLDPDGVYPEGSRWADPVERQQWFDETLAGPRSGPDMTVRAVGGDAPWLTYQRETAGPLEVRLTGGGEQIWADGIQLDPDGVAAAEAKFIENPGSSIYEGTAPQFVIDRAMVDFDREMARYAAVIHDGANPVARLRLFTSTPQAAAFLEARARSILGPNIDLQVVIRP